MTLQELISTMPTIMKFGNKFYDLNQFLSLLLQSDCDIQADDTIIAPYYISQSGRLELYDYDLHIRVVDHSNEENYILAKTGKRSLDEIDPTILNKLKKCYLEVIRPQNMLLKSEIIAYVCNLIHSPEIVDRIESLGDERFSKNNLFFEVY